MKLIARVVFLTAIFSLLALPAFPVLAQPALTLSQPEGFVGQAITINGSGFGNYHNIIIYLDGEIADMTSSNEDGLFAYDFTIPESVRGQHTIGAEDADYSHVETTFFVESSIALSSPNGAVGEQITVFGYGFDAGVPVILSYDNAQVDTTPLYPVTDSKGNFIVDFIVPPLFGSAGGQLIEVFAGTGSGVAILVVEADISITPVTKQESPGYAGMELVINGSGYESMGTVTITYLSDPVELATTSIGVDGTFTVTVTIPPSAAGVHTIEITDGIITRQIPFYMEGEAPNAPSLSSPQASAETNPQTAFSWQSVSDPSGVTYTLQIATNDSFTSVIFNKQGIVTPLYTLTETEKLSAAGSNSSYYWRVKAIDGAGNEGEWSIIGAFSVSEETGMPEWTLYALGGAGVILLIGLLIWLNRRRSSRF